MCNIKNKFANFQILMYLNRPLKIIYYTKNSRKWHKYCIIPMAHTIIHNWKNS